jgi:hypothetical protein
MKFFRIVAAVILFVLVGLCGIAMLHARNLKSLSISVTTANGTYQAVIQNPSVLPVVVSRCVENARPMMSHDPKAEYLEGTVQRAGSGSDWESVYPVISCEGSDAKRNTRLLWRGEQLYGPMFHPRLRSPSERPEWRFQSGDKVRFILYLRSTTSSSGAVTSPEVTIH